VRSLSDAVGVYPNNRVLTALNLVLNMKNRNLQCEVDIEEDDKRDH